MVPGIDTEIDVFVDDVVFGYGDGDVELER